jgi:hypothetical protein
MTGGSVTASPDSGEGANLPEREGRGSLQFDHLQRKKQIATQQKLAMTDSMQIAAQKWLAMTESFGRSPYPAALIFFRRA